MDDLDETDDIGSGYDSMGASPMEIALLNQLSGGYTTQAAHDLAQRTWDELSTEREANRAEEDQHIEEMSATAKQAKAEIMAARQRLLNKKFNDAEIWFAAAQGFGAPTKTGNFFESLGAAAGQAREPLGKRREWNDARDAQALQYLLQSGQIDDQQAARELALLAARNKQDTDLQREAMKVLGKEIRGQNNMKGPVGADAADRAYAKDYIDFIQNGAPNAAKSIQDLKEARGKLRGGSDTLTGPVVGWVPKKARDMFVPDSGNIQDMVEYTVQQSLRPILGAQFTQQEGENLIRRVYNPLQEESVNARRLDRLIDLTERAYNEKRKAANYFSKYGTLKGYKGRTAWSIQEFYPTQERTVTQPRRPGQADTGADATPTKNVRDLPDSHDKFWTGMKDRWLNRFENMFADGGEVSFDDDFDPDQPAVVPDGWEIVTDNDGTQRLVKAATATSDMYEDPTDVRSLSTNLGDAALGGAGTYFGTKYGIRGALGLKDLVTGQRVKKGERRIVDMMEAGRAGDQSAEEWADRLDDMLKRKVPGMALDAGTPEMRGLAEAAMQTGVDEAPSMLDQMERRQNEARGRVSDRVNEALKPDDFFDQDEKLREALYTNSRPLYDQAYSAFPGIESEQLFKIMDTPSGKKAVKAAIEALKDQPGVKIGKTDALGMVRKPSLAFLDEVKRQLDQMVNVAERKGATAKGRSIRSLRNSLRDELDKATTDANGKSLYTEARKTYAGDLEVLDALQSGRQDFMSMNPREVEKLVGNMSFAERDAFRTGAATKLFEVLDKPSNDLNAARRIVNSPATMGRLRPLFDNDAQFNKFREALNHEMDMFENSTGTLRRGEAGRMANINPKEGWLQRLAKKAPMLGLTSVPAWTVKQLREKPAIEQKEANEILKVMRSTDQSRIRSLQSKVGRATRRRKISGRAGALAGLAAASAALLGDGDDDTGVPDLEAMPAPPKVSPDDPSLAGLSPEEREWALKQAQ